MLSRLYNDYIMPNRYKEYEELLNLFKSSGYEFICVKDYKKLENDKGKYIIIRHDIDSDIKIARKMFEIENYKCIDNVQESNTTFTMPNTAVKI